MDSKSLIRVMATNKVILISFIYQLLDFLGQDWRCGLVGFSLMC